MAEREKKGLGSDAFGRDIKPKKKRFGKATDDGERRLHAARFLPLPFGEPSGYWRKVPTAHEEVYRHLPLADVGAGCIPEKTIVRMHNRKAVVTLDMMAKEVKDLRQAQMAVVAFAAAQRFLHPVDLGGHTILAVLTEANWGEAVVENAKARLSLIKKYFDDATEENSSRAARRQPPMKYSAAKTLWVDTVATVNPQFGLAAMGRQMAAMGSGGASNSGGSQKGAGGGSQHQAGNRNHNQQQKGKPGAQARTPARFQGMPVCFGYNTKAGCTRIPPGTTAASCKDGNGNGGFAHVCNHFFGDGKGHCLAGHPRFGNH